MKRPRFSIVIPTRNRCELLRRALASALVQSVGDYEIVVSANACTDATRRVVDEMANARVRLIETPRPMFMHESWQFALDHAQGEYITFLCDDDALTPGALETVGAALDLAPADVTFWPLAYWRVGPQQDDRAATFRFGAAYSGRLLEVDQARLIDAAYDLRVTFNEYIPRLLNSMISAEMVARAKARNIRLFRPSCPDYSSMLASAVLAKRMACIDYPLGVAGLTPASIGTSAMQRGEAARAFYRELLANEPALVRLPILLSVRCWIAQTYAQCAADYPPLHGRQINLAHLFVWSWNEIQQWRQEGCEVEKLENEWRAALQQQPNDIQRRVGDGLGSSRWFEAQHFLTSKNASRLHQTRECIAGGGAASEHGLSSIDDFAMRMDGWITAHAAEVMALWTTIVSLSSGRLPVFYGMGNFGQSLVRGLHLCGVNEDEYAVADDGADGFSRSHRVLRIEAASPVDHFVVTTPEQVDAMRKRLECRGFRHGGDWLTVQEVVDQVARGRTQQVAPVTSRVAECRQASR